MKNFRLLSLFLLLAAAKVHASAQAFNENAYMKLIGESMALSGLLEQQAHFQRAVATPLPAGDDSDLIERQAPTIKKNKDKLAKGIVRAAKEQTKINYYIDHPAGVSANVDMGNAYQNADENLNRDQAQQDMTMNENPLLQQTVNNLNKRAASPTLNPNAKPFIPAEAPIVAEATHAQDSAEAARAIADMQALLQKNTRLYKRLNVLNKNIGKDSGVNENDIEAIKKEISKNEDLLLNQIANYIDIFGECNFTFFGINSIRDKNNTKDYLPNRNDFISIIDETQTIYAGGGNIVQLSNGKKYSLLTIRQAL